MASQLSSIRQCTGVGRSRSGDDHIVWRISTAFYHSYYDISEITSDWQERMPPSNLYPLLNHLLLFDGSYLRDITEICRRFA